MVFQSFLHLIWRFLFERILGPWHSYCPWKIPQTTCGDGTFQKYRKRTSFGPLSWVCDGLFFVSMMQIFFKRSYLAVDVVGRNGSCRGVWHSLKVIEVSFRKWDHPVKCAVVVLCLLCWSESLGGSLLLFFYFLLEDLWTDNARLKNPQRNITVMVLITSQRSTSGMMAAFELTWHQADKHFCKLLERNPGMHGPLNCTLDEHNDSLDLGWWHKLLPSGP